MSLLRATEKRGLFVNVVLAGSPGWNFAASKLTEECSMRADPDLYLNNVMIILLVWTKSELVKKVIANCTTSVPSEMMMSVERVWNLCQWDQRIVRHGAINWSFIHGIEIVNVRNVTLLPEMHVYVDYSLQTMQHALVNISIKLKINTQSSSHFYLKGYDRWV